VELELVLEVELEPLELLVVEQELELVELELEPLELVVVEQELELVEQEEVGRHSRAG